MKLLSNAALLLVLAILLPQCTGTLSTNSEGDQSLYVPVAYYLGNGPSIDGLQPYSGGDLTLDIFSPVLTLDYGAEVAGLPFVQVSSMSGPSSQIEIKYSEPFDGLDKKFSDGPWYLKRMTPCILY